MQQRTGGLVVEHDIIKSRQKGSDKNVDEGEQKRLPPAHQALVRPHPKNSRKALYIGTHAAQIVGWSATKSNAFLQELSDHATQSKFVCRHAWRAHDLVMWANTRAVHRRRPGISPRSPAY
jgi:alpha-ketoglutarate-dependent 2,4-dichlorophenoxyacetate dioxygenase